MTKKTKNSKKGFKMNKPYSACKKESKAHSWQPALSQGCPILAGVYPVGLKQLLECVNDDCYETKWIYLKDGKIRRGK